MTDVDIQSFYKGLKALAESSFPKKCNNCGKTYQTAEEFIAETENVNTHRSGLKSSIDDDDGVIVELFRNCHCGSTLMDAFNNRRDLSQAGEKRRKNFEKVLKMVEDKYQLERDIARAELLKVVRGQHSEIIKNILPGQKAKPKN